MSVRKRLFGPVFLSAELLLFLIVAGGTFAGVVAARGMALDVQSRQFADGALQAIVGHWSEQALIERASPALVAAAGRSPGIHQTFAAWSVLGRFLESDGLNGRAVMALGPGRRGLITAAYEGTARFEDGIAHVRLTLQKSGWRWRITSFTLTPQEVFGRPDLRQSKAAAFAHTLG